ARNFNHHILAIQRPPQPARLLDGPVCIVGKYGRAFETDKSVGAASLFIDFGEDIRRHLYVPDGEGFIDFLRALALLCEFPKLVPIEVGTGDGLLEYRGIGSED